VQAVQLETWKVGNASYDGSDTTWTNLGSFTHANFDHMIKTSATDTKMQYEITTSERAMLTVLADNDEPALNTTSGWGNCSESLVGASEDVFMESTTSSGGKQGPKFCRKKYCYTGAACVVDCNGGDKTTLFIKKAPCPAGTYGTQCTSCAAGKYQDTAAQSDCKSCPAGRFSGVKAAGCTACAAGKKGRLAVDQRTACDDCEAGYYASSPGAEGCAQCVAGTYAGSSGASVCDTCVAGKAAQVNATECLGCASGTFSSAGSAICTSCPTGQYSDASDSTVRCSLCDKGTFAATVKTANCAVCSPGQYSLNGAAACTTCLAGTWAAAGATICESCAAGSIAATAGLQNCTTCPAGQFGATAGLSTCTACPAGKAVNTTGNSGCSPCEAGTFTSASTSKLLCSHCPAGRISGAGVAACDHCPAGTYSGRKHTVCSSCVAGTYTATADQSECTHCESGKYVGFEAATGCVNCVAGTSSHAGNYTGRGATVCSLCSAGKLSAAVAPNCVGCGLGKFTDVTGRSVCTNCAAGQFMETEGSTVCMKCAIGKHSHSGSIGCNLAHPSLGNHTGDRVRVMGQTVHISGVWKNAEEYNSDLMKKQAYEKGYGKAFGIVLCHDGQCNYRSGCDVASVALNMYRRIEGGQTLLMQYTAIVTGDPVIQEHGISGTAFSDGIEDILQKDRSICPKQPCAITAPNEHLINTDMEKELIPKKNLLEEATSEPYIFTAMGIGMVLSAMAFSCCICLYCFCWKKGEHAAGAEQSSTLHKDAPGALHVDGVAIPMGPSSEAPESDYSDFKKDDDGGEGMI
jgi:hypothetical protein